MTSNNAQTLFIGVKINRTMAIPPDIEKYVIEQRRFIHKHPELSFKEIETSKHIESELRSFGLEVEHVGATGLVSDIKGKEAGKIIVLRADMDALPVTEENKVDFSSVNPGVMHACGHDAHVAMLLGVAKMLSASGVKKGTVRLIFQQAEENPPGGAIEFVKAGYLKGVYAAVGQHVSSDEKCGQISTYYDYAMANADEFRVKIHGKGGHGSEPEKAVDVLLIGTYYVNLIQSIVSRMIPAFSPAVVTVGTFNSGYRYNIIAAHTEITGTVRTYDESIRKKVKQELGKILKSLCETYGADYEFEYIEGYPAVRNNRKITETLESVAAKVVGNEGILHKDPIMGGEDFAYFAREVPSTFYFLGTASEKKGKTSPNHSPTFDIDEDAMKYGVEIMLNTAMKLLD